MVEHVGGTFAGIHPRKNPHGFVYKGPIELWQSGVPDRMEGENTLWMHDA